MQLMCITLSLYEVYISLFIYSLVPCYRSYGYRVTGRWPQEYKDFKINWRVKIVKIL